MNPKTKKFEKDFFYSQISLLKIFSIENIKNVEFFIQSGHKSIVFNSIIESKKFFVFGCYHQIFFFAKLADWMGII